MVQTLATVKTNENKTKQTKEEKHIRCEWNWFERRLLEGSNLVWHTIYRNHFHLSRRCSTHFVLGIKRKIISIFVFTVKSLHFHPKTYAEAHITEWTVVLHIQLMVLRFVFQFFSLHSCISDQFKLCSIYVQNMVLIYLCWWTDEVRYVRIDV